MTRRPVNGLVVGTMAIYELMKPIGVRLGQSANSEMNRSVFVLEPNFSSSHFPIFLFTFSKFATSSSLCGLLHAFLDVFN